MASTDNWGADARIGIFIVGALMLSAPGKDKAAVVPILAAYGFAGYRLMPSLQQIYAAFAQQHGDRATLGGWLIRSQGRADARQTPRLAHRDGGRRRRRRR